MLVNNNSVRLILSLKANDPGENFSMMIRRDSTIWGGGGGGKAKNVCSSYVPLLIENRHELVTISVTLPRMAKFSFILIISQ